MEDKLLKSNFMEKHCFMKYTSWFCRWST